MWLGFCLAFADLGWVDVVVVLDLCVCCPVYDLLFGWVVFGCSLSCWVGFFSLVFLVRIGLSFAD